MSTPRARTERLPAAARRRTIEEAATVLLAERGYRATTIEDIVSHAAVTKPVLYRHFASKQALAMALLERHRDALAFAPLEALMAIPDAPFAERLDAMLEAWFGYVAANPFVRLLLQDASGDQRVGALVEELHGRQRAADIALLREFAPHVPPVELEATGELIRGALAGLGLWVLDHPDEHRAAIAAMHRMVLGLVEPDAR